MADLATFPVAASFGKRKRLRMLHCCPNLTGGGAERQLSYLATHWAMAGHEVHIAYLAGGAVPDEMRSADLVLHPLQYRSSYDPYLFLQLIRLMRDIRPDLVQTWILQMDVLAGLAAFVTRRPWLLREPSNAMAWESGWKSRARRMIAWTAKAIIANSAGGLAYWAPYKRPAALHQIENALPLEALHRVRPAKPPELGLPPDRPIIMYAGRLSEEKNLEVLIQAVAKVVGSTCAVAVLYGDGPMRNRLLSLVASLGVADRILLPGQIPNVWGAMKCADVFVTVSRFEGRPNAVLEAIACGCPVIVSDIPAHREFLDDSSAILVRTYCDPDCVAEAIMASLDQDGAAIARAEQARGRLRNWDISAIAQKYEALYSTILATPSGVRGVS